MVTQGVGGALVAFSAYMLSSGANTFIATQGLVRGAEFSLLIAITNQLTQFTIWLALYASWSASRSSFRQPVVN